MRIGSLTLLLHTLILLFISIEMSAASPQKPDFAYPKVVKENSLKELSKAIAAKDGPMIVRSLLDDYLATLMMNNDSLDSCVSKIEEVTSEMQDPALKSVLNILEAKILSEKYQSDRWRFDERTLPLLPYPAKMSEWSGEQFKAKILELVDDAMSNEEALKSVPLEKYNCCITFGEQRQDEKKSKGKQENGKSVYFRTLYDFVAYQSITRLTPFSGYGVYLPWGLLTPYHLYVEYPFNCSSPYCSKILGIYAGLLKTYEKETAPFIYADIERINFVARHLYDSPESGLSVTERKNRLLMELYEKYRDSEYSGDILLEIDPEDIESLYSNLNSNIKRFPNYARINNLKNRITEICRKSMYVKYPTNTGPGEEVEMKVNMANVALGKLLIYDVSNEKNITGRNDYYSSKGLPKSAPCAVIDVKASDSTLPFREEVTLKHTFDKCGDYIVIAVIEGEKAGDYYNCRKIRVSNFAIAFQEFGQTGTIFGLKGKDGEPVADAEIFISDRSGSIPVKIGKTSADGSLKLSGKNRGFASIVKGDDKYASPVYVGNSGYTPDTPTGKKESYMTGFTSLPLYRPGDRMEWTAIFYELKKGTRRLLPNKKVEITMYDGNGDSICSTKKQTDSFGRISGYFDIPKDRLDDEFYLESEDFDGTIYFEVSDYKLPGFRIELENVETDVPETGDATLRGKVMTYSGFPLENTKVTIQLSAQEPFFRWRRNGGLKFATLETTTDAKGKFEMVLPDSVLKQSPIPYAVYHAEVSGMSVSGETQTAFTNFAMKSRYSITVSAPKNIDITNPTSAIKIEVRDYKDSEIELPLEYKLSRDDKTITSGELMINQKVLDLRSVASGVYTLTVSAKDSTLASPSSVEVTLYRPTDKNTPDAEKLLWYADSSVKVKEGESGSWLYAVNCPTYLLLTLHTDTTIISREWVKAEAGMHTQKIDLPKGVEKAKLEISLTGNYLTASTTVTVESDLKEKELKFSAESFRDHLIPGSEERWKFRVTDESGSGVRSAVIMDMYNTAMDALATQRWEFYPRSEKISYRYLWQEGISYPLSATEYASVNNPKFRSGVGIIKPEFYTYGFQNNLNAIRVRGYATESVSRGVMMSKVMKEVETEEASAEDMDGVVETALPTSGLDELGQSDQGSTEKDNGSPEVYRDREVALAFFRPMLETDKNGDLSFTFTVPNANTTWGVRAVAYSDSLLSTSFAENVVANKPVMVQPNLPRFLRSGDKAIVKAMVMNNGESEQKIESEIELFTADGRVVKTLKQSDMIGALSAATVRIEIEAPTDESFIGYRIKSTNGEFTDGEQTLLPVLPAESPVFNTYPFYLSPDSEVISMELPKKPADAKATLQYCNNPIWYVVTALPGILDINAKTANEAAASIFSAATAAGIVRDNPTIGKAIAEWNRSDRSDETLKSMLERNEDLKQVLLQATPWMLDASSDNARMARLSLLFDKDQIDKTIAANIETLKNLQCADGGWAWYSSYKESSQWATENVLLLLGDLFRAGYLPESKELRKMITKALEYIDRETSEDFNKYPEGDYRLYVILRDRYANFSGAPGVKSKIVAKTVKSIISKWKEGNVVSKAIDAQILQQHGHHKTAVSIIESLRQFAEYTPAKGMWWPSLDNMTVWSMGKIGCTALILKAFVTVEPTSADIERIRQWLIREKEAKDWGSSVTTTSVIATILSTSKSEMKPSGKFSISIGGKDVKTDMMEKYTGYLRQPVDWKSAEKTELKIKRSDKTPAWGAVYLRFTDTMKNVEAAGCEELTIDKKLVVNTSADNGTPAVKYAEELTTGERVSVTLTINAGRDMDYVTLVDERPACFEPVEQLPVPLLSQGIYFYRENRDSETRMFIRHLPKGTYVLTYDVFVNNAGEYASGLATIQSQYAPQFTAHSGGTELTVK